MRFYKTLFILISVAFGVACAGTKTVETNRAGNSSVAVSNAKAQPALSAAADNRATPQALYAESCVGCHRERGEGGAAEYEGKKIKVPAFQSKGAMNTSDDNLYAHIADGEEDEMPAFKDHLTEEQMRNLVKFIRKEFQGK